MPTALSDLADEQAALAALLDSLSTADYSRASAADGWLVRDQVAHLADTSHVAADTLTGGPRTFAAAVGGFASAAEFTQAPLADARRLPIRELVSWWSTWADQTRHALADRAEDTRVAWGFGMPADTFAAARLMEHWAHGLDIADALGLPVPGSARLRHVAELGRATLRYAAALARVPWPTGRTLRLELSDADDAVHRLGQDDATDSITGSLLAWCRVATRRTRGAPPRELRPSGPLAELALAHARAYL